MALTPTSPPLPSSFSMHPLPPSEVSALLAIEALAFATNPIGLAAASLLTTPATRAIDHAWKRTRMLNALEGRGDDSRVERHWRKMVYTPPATTTTTTTTDAAAAAQVVAVACWCAPALDPTKPALEPHTMEPAVEDAPAENQQARALFQRLHDTLTGARSEALMGAERDTHYWYLDTLATVPAFQGRGLGSMLVRWGIEHAREDARARPGRVRGVWTIATPAGVQTYLKAGMREVGSEVFDYGEGGGGRGQRYVWLVMEFGG